MASPARSIGSLTAWRFVAAMAIVLHHSKYILLPGSFLAGFPLATGVTFFYVLSGFILTYVYADGMNGLSRRDFYVARVARIWPATMLSLVLLFLLVPRQLFVPFYGLGWNNWQAAPPLLSFVTMTQAWIPVPAYYFGFNAVAWSVSVEFAFYLAFPFLLRSLTRTWWWKAVLVGALSFGLIAVTARLGLPEYSVESLDQVTRHGLLYVDPVSRAPEFFLGMLLGLAFLRVPPVRRGVARWTILEAAVVVGVLIAIPKISVFRYNWLTTDPTVGSWLDNMGFAATFGALVFVFAINSGAISRLLSTRVPVLLGEISFSIYLVHQILINWYQAHRSADWMPVNHRFVLLVLASCLIAYASFRLVETPARQALRRRFSVRHTEFEPQAEFAGAHRS